jgi:predicted ATPase
MHSWYSYLERHPGPQGEPVFHEMSQGESFLAVLGSRFGSRGFYRLDEPEAALSFSSTLGLISALNEVASGGGQVLCATHSPVLAAMPGATLLEVGERGQRETTWDELEIVRHWRAYLEAPQCPLRHVLDD